VNGLCVESCEKGNICLSNLARPEWEQQANLQLIAAAPDLLELAKQYASECSGCDGTGFADKFTGHGTPEYMEHTVPCSDCADIRAVISKAEGK
jgi:hypothetical protein